MFTHCKRFSSDKFQGSFSRLYGGYDARTAMTNVQFKAMLTNTLMEN